MATTLFSTTTRLSFVALMLIGFLAGRAAAQPAAAKESAIFKQDVGRWGATMKVYSAKGAEPTVGTATETCEMIGDLWLVTRFESELGGQKFVGLGT